MMNINFIIYEKVEELDLVGSWELIGLLADKGFCEKPKLISLNSMNPVGEHGMRFSADYYYQDCETPDVIIIPGGSGAREVMNDDNVIQFLQRCEADCRSVLSICTAMYLMQKAGLLTGRKATTHWAFIDYLKQDQSVEVIEERFVSDGKIWSSAGVSAGIDMTLSFIAETFGEQVASEIQLEAEYFPSSRVYGSPQKHPKAVEYIKNLK